MPRHGPPLHMVQGVHPPAERPHIGVRCPRRLAQVSGEEGGAGAPGGLGPPAKNGGGGGIRTPGELAPTSDFKSGALNHSATPPYVIIYKFIRQHKCLFRSLEAGSCIS